ncbi:MAG: PAS domain-containing protein [Anaerolineales bacterium]
MSDDARQNEIRRLRQRLAELEGSSARAVNADIQSPVIDMIGALVVVLDADERIVRFNQACERTTGYRAAEVLGQNIFDLLIPPEQHPATRAIWQALMAGEPTNAHENDWVCQDGSWRRLAWHNTRMTDASGTFTYVISTGVDVTDARQIAQEKSETEARLKAIIRNFPFGVISMFDRDKRYVYIDGAILHAEGYQPEDWIGLSLSDIRTADVVAQLEPRWQALLADGEPQSFEVIEDNDRYDVYLYPLRDAEGVVIAGLSFSMRVTQQRRHEQELQQTRDQLQTILKNIPAMLFTLDQEGIFQLIEGRDTDLLGLPAENLLGESYFVACHEFPALLANLQHAFSGEILRTVERFRQRVIDMHLSPIRDEGGNVQRVIGFVLDITEKEEALGALRAERDLTNIILDTVGTLIVMLTPTGHIVRANRTFERLMGYPNERLKGDHFAERFVDPANREPFQDIFDGLRTGIMPESYESIWRSAQGRRRLINWSSAPIMDSDNQVRYLLLTGVDVTEGRQAAEQLYQSEARLRALTSNFPNGDIFMFDHDLRYLFADGTNLKAKGATPEEFIGKTLEAIVQPETAQILRPVWEAALRGESHTVEVTLDDDIYEIHTHPIPGEDNTVSAGMAFSQKVTERKLAERARRQATERLLFVVRNLPVVLYVLTPDGEIQLAEGRGLRALARDGYTLAGQTLQDVYADSPDIIADFEAVRAGADVHNYREAFDKLFEVVWQPVHSTQGVLQNIICIAIDVTDKREFEFALARQARELARSNQELENFAYVASHDLQEPLRMVTSYLNLLERRYKGRLDAEADEFIGYAVDGATRMKSLINALLDYSRLNTARAPFESVALDEVLADVLIDLQVSIQETNATISADPLPQVQGERTQLRRLLQNLIENALKFRRAEVAPQIHVALTSETDYEWTISVQDNGIGFEEKYGERIFVIFQRLHTPAEYPGTGLGLAMAKRIIELHGGRIWARPNPETGATFFFALPKDPKPR